MNIIIEGPDNVGKSTLINNIKKTFNTSTFHTLHYSNVRQPTIEEHIEYSSLLYKEMFSICDFITKNQNSNTICDRSHIGEMVYSPLYRNYSGDYVLYIEKEQSNLDDYILIVLIDDPNNLIKRDDGLSHSVDPYKKQQEIDLFKDAYNKSLIKNKLLVDVSKYDEKQLAKFTTELIKLANK